MSKGGFAFNPVYEIQVTMGSLCNDAKDGSRDADARVKEGLATLYADLSKVSDEWRQRDLRVVYHGSSLRQTLTDTYAAERQACVVTADGNKNAQYPLEKFVSRSPDADVASLISQIDDAAGFVKMQPVGN